MIKNKLKKSVAILLSMLFMVNMLPTIHVFADDTSGSCGDNVTYSFDQSTDTLTISGKGRLKFCGSWDGQPWNTYKNFIKAITIQEGMTSVAAGAFSDCSGLTSIDVDRENANYKSINGILFSKDGKKLIKYPEGKNENSYKIPDSVEKIEEHAFLNCKNLHVDINRAVGLGCKDLQNSYF